MRSTISVVIVAGACGIAAGTPLAILGGIGRAARLGAIIKGGLYLESPARVDTIVLRHSWFRGVMPVSYHPEKLSKGR
jgi:P-type Cu+ transporter